jgi:hypothetical protein
MKYAKGGTNMNKKILTAFLSFVLVGSLLISTPVFAQDEPLPDPGITPDSPFYFLDNFGKNLGLLFAFGPDAKAKKALEYAEERLAEAQAMATQNKSQALERAAAGYDKFLLMASAKAEEARQQGIPEDLSERVALATSKHVSVLDAVADAFPETVPEQARQAISRAKDAAMKGMESALKGVAQENPGRAAEITITAVEARLNRAKDKAKVNNAEEVEEALSEAEKLFEFEVEISEIAKGIGKGETNVKELIAKATYVHLAMLAEVHEKVPEQAEAAIQDAIANMMVNREEVLQRLEEKGALGNIPQEVPALEGLREQVMERVQERTEENVPEELQQQIKERIENRLSNFGPQTLISSR